MPTCKQPRSLLVPDLLDTDVAGSCAAASGSDKQRQLDNKENLAPNVLAQLVVERTKRIRRVKKVASRPVAPAASAAVPATAAAAAAAAPAAVAAEPAQPEHAQSSRSDSPRANKQQKLSSGEAVLLRRCAALEEGSSNISPPLGRVTERHIAFALRAKAIRARGGSSLQQSSLLPAPAASEVDTLSRGVATVEL